MAFHLAGGKPGPVAKARTAARDVLRDPREVPVTSPASGAGSAPDLPGYAPTTGSAQSETGRVASPPATADGGSRRLGLALVVIATAQLMVVLDATIVNVALPHIERALGFSGSGLEWVVNAYAVTFGGLLLLGGRAGDILGRRRVFVFGLLLFSAASLLGGFATSEWWLLTARAVQGVGGAVIAPTALALITTNFPKARRVTGRLVSTRRWPAPAARRACCWGHTDHLPLLAVGAVRQRPDRDRGGGRGAAGAVRIAPSARPDRRGRRGHRHRRRRALGLRPVQGRHRARRGIALG